MTTITRPVQYYGKTFYRSQMKPLAWYVIAGRRLTNRWAKRIGNVLRMQPHLEHEHRPEYRDFAIYITMEYVVRDGEAS